MAKKPDIDTTGLDTDKRIFARRKLTAGGGFCGCVIPCLGSQVFLLHTSE